MNTASAPPYVGRFAPSPSGPLHLGSLTCALASYLDARQHNGYWLLRLEDIDPDREPPGAADAILHCLETHGLHWDGAVLQQSKRSNSYLKVIDELKRAEHVYRCSCTRKRLAGLGGRYDGHCRAAPPAMHETSVLRLKVSPPLGTNSQTLYFEFEDRVFGRQRQELIHTCGDFIVHRKHGLFAYQLAVVIDDIEQGVTDVVRGSDLLEATGRQMYLYNLFNKTPPRYGHVPVVIGADGLKLSKQNHAPALDNCGASGNLCEALQHLGVALPSDLHRQSVSSILEYAQLNFRLEHVLPGAHNTS